MPDTLLYLKSTSIFVNHFLWNKQYIPGFHILTSKYLLRTFLGLDKCFTVIFFKSGSSIAWARFFLDLGLS